MHRFGELHVIAEGGTDHLREIQGILRSAGIAGEIVAPPKSQCSS
jgi:hypothetical protein